jgi:ribonuclease HIII
MNNTQSVKTKLHATAYSEVANTCEMKTLASQTFARKHSTTSYRRMTRDLYVTGASATSP